MAVGMVEASRTVGLSLEAPQPQRRITVAFRFILAIPHLLYLVLLTWAAEFALIAAWVAALVTGRMPEGIGTFVGRVVQYTTRVYAYGSYLLTDRYPPFRLDAWDYPVSLDLPERGRLNRAAVFFRFILVLPAGLAVGFVGVGVGVAGFLIWLVVLIAGQTPRSLFEAEAAILRFQARFYAYAWMLTSEYPRGITGDDSAPVTAATDSEAEGPVAPRPGDVFVGVEPTAERSPRITRLVLSRTAKRLVVVFFVVGILTEAGFFVAAVIAANNQNKTLATLKTDYGVLVDGVRRWSADVQSCAASNDGAECLHAADQRLATAFDTFRSELLDLRFVGLTTRAAQKVEDDSTQAVNDLHQLAVTDDPGTYRSLSVSFGDHLRNFDGDVRELAIDLGASD